MSDDTISRKATICAMEGRGWYHINKDGRLVHGANSKEDEPLYKAKDVYAVLNKMPSAQPEIVRCCKCGFWDRDTLRHQFNDFRDWNEAECMVLAERDPYHEMDRYTEADDYCSRAERRTDDR